MNCSTPIHVSGRGIACSLPQRSQMIRRSWPYFKQRANLLQIGLFYRISSANTSRQVWNYKPASCGSPISGLKSWAGSIEESGRGIFRASHRYITVTEYLDKYSLHNLCKSGGGIGFLDIHMVAIS